MFTTLKRTEQNSYQESIIENGLANSRHIWDFIKKFHPDNLVDTLKPSIEIEGKSGNELANLLLKRSSKARATGKS
jgi:hypothetical protein